MKLFPSVTGKPKIKFAIHTGKVVDRDPAEVEAKLLEQQDEIEFLLGADCFEKRDRALG